MEQNRFNSARAGTSSPFENFDYKYILYIIVIIVIIIVVWMFAKNSTSGSSDFSQKMKQASNVVVAPPGQ